MVDDSRPALEPLSAPTTRTDLVIRLIKDSILSGRLAEGEPLVERDLAERLGVSKTPVREALIALASSGLVTTGLNRRITVARITPDSIRNVFEIRQLLEPHAFTSSMASWTPDHDHEAESLLDQADAVAAREQWVALANLTRRFHRHLYSLCGNQLLVDTLDILQDRVSLMSVRSWEQRPGWRSELADHRQILAAIRAQDADLVRELTSAHVSPFSVLVDKVEADSVAPAARRRA